MGMTSETAIDKANLIKSGIHQLNGLQKSEPKKVHKIELVWRRVIDMTFFHLGALYGIYLILSLRLWTTFAFGTYYTLYTRKQPLLEIYDSN